MFIQEHALASQQRILSKSELLSNILVFKFSFSVNVKLQKKEKKKSFYSENKINTHYSSNHCSAVCILFLYISRIGPGCISMCSHRLKKIDLFNLN